MSLQRRWHPRRCGNTYARIPVGSTFNTEIRADIKRAVTIFFSVLAAITVVIILIVLTASGLLERPGF